MLTTFIKALMSAEPDAVCGTEYGGPTPKISWPWGKPLLHSVDDQPDAASVQAQYDRVPDALAGKLPRAADHLEAAREDLLAFTPFPQGLWRQVWSNNPQERLNKEIRCRTEVVGILPDRTAPIRLVGAVLAQQHHEWTEARRYPGFELIHHSPAIGTDTTGTKEDTSPTWRSAPNHPRTTQQPLYTTQGLDQSMSRDITAVPEVGLEPGSCPCESAAPPGNLADPAQSGTGTNPSEALGVHILHTLFLSLWPAVE